VKCEKPKSSSSAGYAEKKYEADSSEVRYQRVERVVVFLGLLKTFLP
jgi:hypothetical protein